MPVGCVWTSLRAGRDLEVLTCTAATSSMSMLFGQCDGGRAIWAELGWAASARAVFFDQEQADWDLVYPSKRTVPKPDEDQYLLEGEDFDFECCVDGYYGEALRLAGLAQPI